ncbi:MAG: class I SAM-dependent methyltransferase [Bacteroidetes bacterium]|nr:class I SAM-dependent methyltransferase [Bacteroidota bacterium]
MKTYTTEDLKIRTEFWNGRWQAAEIPSHDVARIQKILELIPNDVDTILDVGCGDGRVTNALFHHYPFVIGVDISTAGLGKVQPKTICGSSTTLPFRDNTFDLVLCGQVLEHLDDLSLDSTMSELMRVSRRYVLVDVPYQENLEFGMVRCDKCLSVFHGSLHLRSFSKESLKNCFAGKSNIIRCELSGKGNRQYSSVFLTKLNRLFTGYYSYWHRNLRCPICGNPEILRKRARENPLSFALVGLNRLLSTIIQAKARYCHVLFQK